MTDGEKYAVRRWQYVDILKIAALEKIDFCDAWNYSELAESFMNDLFFGFLIENDGGEIIAIGAYNMALDEVDIVNVLVKNEYRGQGLGSKILESMISDMYNRGIIRIFLEVRESNSAARALYKKYGFYEVSTRKNYYGGVETAVIMRKDLPRKV